MNFYPAASGKTTHFPYEVIPHMQLGEAIYGLLNRVVALAILLAVSPLMLFIAIMIKVNGTGSILFAHHRVGMRGTLFRCFKFQTMVAHADLVLDELLQRDPAARAQWNRDQKLTNDPRITPIGKFLRKSSLDELPQLFNVLRGEMNLVGPRPIVVRELGRYGTEKRHYLSVKPGMTGLWQVSGRNLTSYGHRVQLDRRYVIQRSLWLDISILLRTVRVVFTGYGAQ
jgi:lipopolysaccharide/colanic/teichoic acid biosynthesis glycosyltransferase